MWASPSLWRSTCYTTLKTENTFQGTLDAAAPEVYAEVLDQTLV